MFTILEIFRDSRFYSKFVAAFAARPNKLGFLRLIFRDQDDRPIAGGEACRAAHGAYDVFTR